MRHSIRASLCAALVGLLAACGGGGGGGGGGFPLFASGPGATATTPANSTAPVVTGDPASDPATNPTPGPTSATLRGKVSTAAGVPVEGFVVSAGGQRATTAADGQYTLTLASPGASAVLLASKDGYQTMAKQAGLVAGLTTTQDITAYAEGVRATFNASEGKVVIVNGAVIDIPANAIQDAAGSAYTGVVTISASYSSPVTAAGVDGFAQPYAGLDGAHEVTLQSLGVIEAKLFAADGRPLQLATPATLVYPGVDAISTAATIPIWYYDETRTIWVKEGNATRNAVDGSYSASVSHFTQWNLDAAFGTGYSSAGIKACVNYAGGEAVRFGITATLTGPGFSRTLYNAGLTSGSFELQRVPVAQALLLTFEDASGAAPVQLVVEPIDNGAIRELPCVTLTGTAAPVPPKPPEPPVPAPANTPVAAFDGTYALRFGAWSDAVPADQGGFDLRLENGLMVTVSPGTVYGASDPAESIFTLTSVQLAAGGYLMMTGTGSPRGPLHFTGRFFNEVGRPTVYFPMGTWQYLTPPPSGQPVESYFEVRPLA